MRLLSSLLCIAFLCACTAKPVDNSVVMENIRFIPIGDSYTIGTGSSEQQAWPVLLTTHLNEEGIPMTLIANPARNGWTTKDAIEGELPLFEAEKPNFGTILLGANDYVQQVSIEEFRANMSTLIDRMLAVLPSEDRLLLITIPDFFATPVGFRIKAQMQRTETIEDFNDVIREEAAKRNLQVAELYSPSKKMRLNVSLLADDALHPSAKGQELFAEVIYKEAITLLR